MMTPPFLSISLAAFLGCLLALATGKLLSATVRAPLAGLVRRQLGRTPGPGVAKIDETTSSAASNVGSSTPTASTALIFRRKSEKSERSEKSEPGAGIPRARRASTAERRPERDPEEWTDDWERPLPPSSRPSSTEPTPWPDAEPGTLWVSAGVPAGRRASVPAGSVVVTKSGDARIGRARRGEFRGREIEVDQSCALSFAICDVLVRGRSQLWAAGSARGEIPAESFSRAPYGAVPMDPASPEDVIEIVVRNVSGSGQTFLAKIRGEYRPPQGSPGPPESESIVES